MQPFTLILVRHGHVEGIHPERFRGRIDLPLTELGRKQATVTAKFVASQWPAAAIYASPLVRCMDTAQAIGETQGLVVQKLPLLVDIDYGKWQGRTRDDVKAAEPERFNSWMAQPHLTIIEDAETLQDVQARLARALTRCAKRTLKDTVIAVGSRQYESGFSGTGARSSSLTLLASATGPMRHQCPEISSRWLPCRHRQRNRASLWSSRREGMIHRRFD